jgi:hypothetical protein
MIALGTRTQGYRLNYPLASPKTASITSRFFLILWTLIPYVSKNGIGAVTSVFTKHVIKIFTMTCFRIYSPRKQGFLLINPPLVLPLKIKGGAGLAEYPTKL